MSDLINFQIDLKVADGHLETFKGLVAEMISFIKTEEPGTLIYNWYISEANHKAFSVIVENKCRLWRCV